MPGGNGTTFGGESGISCAVAFVSTASSVNTEYLTSLRVDYNINASQKLYFRISRDAGTQASSTSPINPIFNGISPQPWIIPQLNYLCDYATPSKQPGAERQLLLGDLLRLNQF